MGDRADRILPGGAGFLAEHLGYNGFFYVFAGIAVVGATLMLVTGVLGLEQAVSLESIDFKTLFLLFGMIIGGQTCPY